MNKGDQRRAPRDYGPRLNHRIRVPKVRVTDENGDQLGIIPTSEALKRAQDAGLDLVEISPNANPPVCKILDYGKYNFEKQKKEKQQKQASKQLPEKEILIRPRTGKGDLEHKAKQAQDFLEKGHKVRLKLMFRGRENAHKEIGFEMVKEMCELLSEYGKVDAPAKLMGRFVYAALSPKSSKGKASPQKKEKQSGQEQQQDQQSSEKES